MSDSWSVRPALRADNDAVWPLARGFATSFAVERTAFDRTFASLVEAPDALLVVAETPSSRWPASPPPASPSSPLPSPSSPPPPPTPLPQSSVVGYLLATRHLTFLANGPVAWVEELMVDASVRGRGVGRVLMAAAEAWGRDGDAGYVALATRRAGGFYAALGYDESAVFYRKRLR